MFVSYWKWMDVGVRTPYNRWDYWQSRSHPSPSDFVVGVKRKLIVAFYYLFMAGIVIKNVLQIVCNSPKNRSRIHQTHFISGFSLPAMTAITTIKLPNI